MRLPISTEMLVWRRSPKQMMLASNRKSEQFHHETGELPVRRSTKIHHPRGGFLLKVGAFFATVRAYEIQRRHHFSRADLPVLRRDDSWPRAEKKDYQGKRREPS